MKKIGISTVHTGYNYGSALQSYASKVFLKKIGYEGIILSLKGSLIKGRDVRLKKVAVILFRLIRHPKKMKKRAEAYKNSVSVEYSEETKKYFCDFKNDRIKPYYLTWRNFKKLAKSEEYVAFLCGSDQIWNGDTLYVDPQYYLRYAPKEKRIAFSPSFGRENIADYNKEIIKKYISEFCSLSVREESGKRIIKELTGLEAVHLLDPTLMVSGEQWNDSLDLDRSFDKKQKNYILAYFLNEPSDYAKKFLKKLANKSKLKIIALPYKRNEDEWFDEAPSAGPIEFLKLVKNANYVCTDSFHGTAFSINFHIAYYTFERQYGKSEKQSSRINSLLKLVNQEDRFNPIEDRDIDFTYSELVLQKERERAENYLKNALCKIVNKNE